MTDWHEDRFKVNFLARIDVQDDGCWLWTGGGQKERYGRFYAGDTTDQWAHRNAWRLHTGQPIPEGIQIHHVCGVPKCVNPLHLEALTAEEHHRRHPAFVGRPHGLAKRRAERCGCDICLEAERVARHEYLDRVRAEAATGLRPVPHGTSDGYNRFACRCDACREAKTISERTKNGRTGMSLEEWRAVNAAKHGTTSMYTVHKCRCDECRRCWSDYWKAYRLRKKAEAS